MVNFQTYVINKRHQATSLTKPDKIFRAISLYVSQTLLTAFSVTLQLVCNMLRVSRASIFPKPLTLHPTD